MVLFTPVLFLLWNFLYKACECLEVAEFGSPWCWQWGQMWRSCARVYRCFFLSSFLRLEFKWKLSKVKQFIFRISSLRMLWMQMCIFCSMMITDNLYETFFFTCAPQSRLHFFSNNTLFFLLFLLIWLWKRTNRVSSFLPHKTNNRKEIEREKQRKSCHRRVRR